MTVESRLVGLGAGGHAAVVIDILQLCKTAVHGLLDPDPALRGQSVLGVPVLGTDDLIPSLVQEGYRFVFIGLGAIEDTGPRRRLYELALAHGLAPVDAIHPRAVLAASATVGRGTTMMAGAIVNPRATLGDNVVVNTGAIVEHDCVVRDHAHIATAARLGGETEIGEGSHIGIGASVRQSVRIGKGSVVGAGAVVLDDVPDGVVVAGVPARVLREVVT